MHLRRVALVFALPFLSLGAAHCRASRETSAESAESARVTAPPFLAVFSAFPAEMAPLLAQASVDETRIFNGRTFSLGTLRGVHVALGITGIGLDNAHATARAVLADLPVTGVVFSGVAGGPYRIGDVAAPATWNGDTGSFAADPAWLAIAGTIAGAAPCFEQCTVVQWTGDHVCLPHVPGVAVGGVGESVPAQSAGTCDRGGDDVFGCEVGAPEGQLESCLAGGATASLPDSGYPTVVDNETAAVAAEASARGLRFIAFRAMSDGAGDPLGLPGFPGQFFAYYRLAARNAAATTLAFLERLP